MKIQSALLLHFPIIWWKHAFDVIGFPDVRVWGVHVCMASRLAIVSSMAVPLRSSALSSDSCPRLLVCCHCTVWKNQTPLHRCLLDELFGDKWKNISSVYEFLLARWLLAWCAWHLHELFHPRVSWRSFPFRICAQNSHSAFSGTQRRHLFRGWRLLSTASLRSDSYSTNRSLLRSLCKAFLVLAGAEEGVRKSIYLLVAYALDLVGRRSEQQLKVKCA